MHREYIFAFIIEIPKNADIIKMNAITFNGRHCPRGDASLFAKEKMMQKDKWIWLDSRI